MEPKKFGSIQSSQFYQDIKNQQPIQQQEQPKGSEEQNQQNNFQDNVKQVIVQNLAQNLINEMIANDITSLKKSQIVKNKENEKSWLGKCCACFTIEYYQQYFDVTTELVLRRLRASFDPMFNKFFEINNSFKPDLYGPFWVYTTLIFSLAAAGNLAAYFQTQKKESYSYNYNYIQFAATLVYTTGIFFPLLMGFIIRFFGNDQISYIQYLCVYGYASVCYIPVSVFCSIPGQQWQWFLMVYAMGNSSIFLIQNICQGLHGVSNQRKVIILCIIAGSQLFLLLVYKLYFFRNLYSYSSTELLSNLTEHTQVEYQDIRKQIIHNK